MEHNPGRFVSDTIRRLATALGRKLGGLWTSVSVVAFLGFTVAGAAVAGFVAIADGVLEGQTSAFDEAVLRWLAASRRPWLDVAALQITALGNAATLVVVALAAAAVLWGARRKVSVALLALSLATGTAVNLVLKHVFNRPRPEVVTHTVEALTASFPSGHAMMSAVTYGTVAYLVGRMAHGTARWITWTGAAVLVLLVGLSRMYVGVHYPSDVAAGWLGGIAWTGLLVLIFQLLGLFAREMPEIRRAESDLPEERRGKG